MIQINIVQLGDYQLNSLIENHERNMRTQDTIYLEAITELDRRSSGGLNLSKTVSFLTIAAKEGRFVSYGQVAEANNMEWSKVRRLMPKHLDNVLSYCHSNGIPYLTAIVVSKPNLQSGKFDESNLKGFVQCLHRLKLKILDHQQFAQDEQQRVFNWGLRTVDK